MPRGDSPTHRLAHFYVTEIRGEPWSYQLGLRWLKEAKLLINPPKDKGEPITTEEVVIGTLKCLKRGMFDFAGDVNSLWSVTWGTPPYYKQFQEWSAKEPPFYRVGEVELWEEITGKIAFPEKDAILSSIPIIPIIPA